jgi:tetratricopeptide (TPR) repeat protein/DNA-binding XRE family transcriptional regulator
MNVASVQSFGVLLKRYRMAAGLTHAELAERARLSVRAISDLERGINRKPRQDTVRMLVAALALAPGDQAMLEAAIHRGSTSPSHLPAMPGVQLARPAMLPFVGRTQELAMLMRHLTGEGTAVLVVAGEPGIGKSRLLSEAVQACVGRGWCLLAGGCHRRSGDEPYAPIIGALERHLAAQTSVQRRQALRGCSWLARMLPELTVEALPLPAWEVPAAQERRLIFKAATTYLGNVAGPRGVLLFLDDLQWAGQDALDLLASVARAPSLVPLRIVGAYRDTEVMASSPLGLLIADLAREGLAEHLELGPLPDDDAAQLISGLVSEAPLREQVIRRAEGVPFVLVSCALALQTEDGPAISTRDRDVPWNVATTIRQRVAILPEPVPGLLAAAAIVGRQVTRRTLIGLGDQLGWRQHALLAAVDAACHARLLVEEEEDTYSFAHDLIREVVMADLSAARRAALHLHVALVLEAEPGELPAPALAYHFTRAGNAEKAVVYLERAGERAVKMHANAEAEAYYRDLVRQLDVLRRPLDAAGARENLAQVLRITAHFDESLEVALAAMEAYRTAGDTEGMARVGERIGALHMLRGTVDKGLPIVTDLLASLSAQGLSTGGLARLHVGLGRLYFSADRYREMGEEHRRAAELAQEAGDDRLRAVAQGLRAIALCELGQFDEGKRALEESCRLMEATGDDWSLITALNNLACAYDDEGAFDQALECVQRSLALAERIGDAENVAIMAYRCGQDAFYLGDWSRARADYERAVAATTKVGDSRGASYPPAKLARLAQAEGRIDEAMQFSDTALDVATRMRDAQSLRYIHMTLAEYELLDGRPKAARARLIPLLDPPSEEASSHIDMLPLLAWSHLEIGDVAQGQFLVEQCIQRCMDAHLRVVLLDAWRVAAMIATRRDQWQEAYTAAGNALTLASSMRYPYAEAKILYAYALAHLGAGERAVATERLNAALAILHRLGERLYAVHVEHALVGLQAH